MNGMILKPFGAGGRGVSLQIRRSTSSATQPCRITMSNSKVQPGWGFPHPYPPPATPPPPATSERRHAFRAGRLRARLEKNYATQLGAKTVPRSLPEPIFFFLGPILGDFRPSWAHLGPNFVQHRTGKAPRCFKHPKLGPPHQQKPYKNYSFCKVFGCIPHLPKGSKMLPKSAPGPPRDLPKPPENPLPQDPPPNWSKIGLSWPLS